MIEEYADALWTDSLGVYWCQTDKLHITVSCPISVLPDLAADVANSALVASMEDGASLIVWARGYEPSGDCVGDG